ncbi:MAG: hypothetical protein LCH69_09840 [Proteobacteria bacterium]|nr:hypothetical protein [Pseudomonadota bacterium]
MELGKIVASVFESSANRRNSRRLAFRSSTVHLTFDFVHPAFILLVQRRKSGLAAVADTGTMAFRTRDAASRED